MLFIILVLGATLLFYLFYTRNINYWKNNGVPTAKGGHWFFGHYKPLVFSEKQFGVVFQEIYQEHPNAPYVGYMRMCTPALTVRDPEIVRAILSTDFNSVSENEFKVDKNVEFLMGYNPFVLQGQEWKVSRSHATPLTTFVKLKTYFPLMRSVCKEMVDYVKNKADGNGLAELDTRKFSGMYTTDIIANVALGVQNNTFQDENSLFAQLTNDILGGSIMDNIRFYLALGLPKLTPLLGLRFSSKRVGDVLLSLTKSRMNDASDNGGSRHDMFQQMKAFRANDKSQQFTDEYIASHCFSFLIDGYETSSDLMSFTFFELAWRLDVQEKLREEILSMIAETNNEYSVENIEKLKYLDMVVSETLRLHPPINVLAKVCFEDYKVPNTNLILKKGTPINVSVLGLHMDEKYFPNPTIFDPERFTEDAIANRHKFVYLPFGEGPRRCLGMRFGLLQVKLAIVNVLQNFKIKPSAKSNYPLDVDPSSFIARPLNGAWVHFENISNN